MSDSFGARLRQERERRHIALATIAATTKIKVTLFQDLERDDVSRWPAGIFRRSFIRVYAKAIGLDPEVVVREFVERFPDPAELPVPPRVDPQKIESSAAPSDPVLRLTLADAALPFSGGRFLRDVQRRWAAAAWDAGVLLAIGVSIYAVVGRFWTPLGISMFCYYLGGILILGNTPGVCLFAPRPDRPAGDKPAESPNEPAESRSPRAWPVEPTPARKALEPPPRKIDMPLNPFKAVRRPRMTRT
jgi:hypothetical protein